MTGNDAAEILESVYLDSPTDHEPEGKEEREYIVAKAVRNNLEQGAEFSRWDLVTANLKLCFQNWVTTWSVSTILMTQIYLNRNYSRL